MTSWIAAILVCAGAGLLAVDETLRFLAVENVLVNNDGFWTRASDYYLYRDEIEGFHRDGLLARLDRRHAGFHLTCHRLA